MLAALALLLVQAPAPDLAQFSVHELVKEIPRCGDLSWQSSREQDEPLAIRAQNELRERIRKGAVLELADWKTILLEKGYLRWRKRWPKSEPFAIGLHMPHLWQGLKIELTPRILGWSKASATNIEEMCAGFSVNTDYLELGTLFYSDREVVFDLVVRTPIWGRYDDKGGVIERTDHPGSITLELQAVKRLEDTVPPVADHELDARITRLLSAGLRADVQRDPGKSAQRWIRLVLDSHPQGVLLDLELTALQEGRVQGRESIPLGARLLEDPRHVLELPATSLLSKEGARGWTLKLAGTAKYALHDWDATQYWAGEIVVPLADLIRR